MCIQMNFEFCDVGSLTGVGEGNDDGKEVTSL